MGELVPFDRERRRSSLSHHHIVKVQRAGKFRVEVPVLLADLLTNYEQMSEAIWHHVEDFATERGAADIVPRLKLVFVGGFDAAKARDQAWFTDYLSPGMILLCWEASA